MKKKHPESDVPFGEQSYLPQGCSRRMRMAHRERDEVNGEGKFHTNSHGNILDRLLTTHTDLALKITRESQLI